MKGILDQTKNFRLFFCLFVLFALHILNSQISHVFVEIHWLEKRKRVSN